MFKVIIKVRNLKTEKIAKILDRMTNNFNIWLHDYNTYIFFRTRSLDQLFKVRKKLQTKGAEFEFAKIRKVKRLWPRV